MNIALFSDTYLPEINGVATSTDNLATTLRAHGHKVLVVTTNPFSNEVSFEEGIIRIPGIQMKMYYGYRFARFYNEAAAKRIERFHPDVIHVQTDFSIGFFGMFMSRKLHCATVYTFHTMMEDYAYYVTKGHFDRAARHLVRGFFRERTTHFDAIVAPSEKIQDYRRVVGIDAIVYVIPTGIDFDRFAIEREDKKETRALKAQFGILPNEFVILSLGRVAKEKSIDVLLRGYRRFLDLGEPVPTRFVITGWGPAEKELKNLSHALGLENKVVFTGKVSQNETQKYYHLADCFASASITETQGLTFMEAMAASVLTLARYDDNLVGTIQDGKTGFFFFDEHDFSDKLNHVITLDEASKERVRKNALAAVDIYSLEHFYENIMEVYTRVCRQNW